MKKNTATNVFDHFFYFFCYSSVLNLVLYSDMLPCIKRNLMGNDDKDVK